MADPMTPERRVEIAGLLPMYHPRRSKYGAAIVDCLAEIDRLNAKLEQSEIIRVGAETCASVHQDIVDHISERTGADEGDVLTIERVDRWFDRLNAAVLVEREAFKNFVLDIRMDAEQEETTATCDETASRVRHRIEVCDTLLRYVRARNEAKP